VKPRKPIKRKAALPRSSKRIRSRGRPRFKEGRDPEWCEHVRGLPCVLLEQGTCAGRVECAHVKARGAAGKDRGNTVPMCSLHHTIQHTIGRLTFEQRFSIDLAAIATELDQKETW
jgi:hypothetical protein